MCSLSVTLCPCMKDILFNVEHYFFYNLPWFSIYYKQLYIHSKSPNLFAIIATRGLSQWISKSATAFTRKWYITINIKWVLLPPYLALFCFLNDISIRDHFVYAHSQYETTLFCNGGSNWLGAYPKWSPYHKYLTYSIPVPSGKYAAFNHFG